MNSAADWYAEQEYRERCGMPYERESYEGDAKKITNGDKLRKRLSEMTDEQLEEEFRYHICKYAMEANGGKCDGGYCHTCRMEWLRKEANDDDT